MCQPGLRSPVALLSHVCTSLSLLPDRALSVLPRSDAVTIRSVSHGFSLKQKEGCSLQNPFVIKILSTWCSLFHQNKDMGAGETLMAVYMEQLSATLPSGQGGRASAGLKEEGQKGEHWFFFVVCLFFFFFGLVSATTSLAITHFRSLLSKKD